LGLSNLFVENFSPIFLQSTAAFPQTAVSFDLFLAIQVQRDNIKGTCA